MTFQKIVKKSTKKVPALSFYLDDSLDHIDEIDDSIKNPFNPIKNKMLNRFTFKIARRYFLQEAKRLLWIELTDLLL